MLGQVWSGYVRLAQFITGNFGLFQLISALLMLGQLNTL
jgi:hypothetical protein